MRKKMRKKLILLGILTFVLAASSGFAEDVFMTKKGKKYHTELCRFIKGQENLKVMPKTEAMEKYIPCKYCFSVNRTNEQQSQSIQNKRRTK